MISGRSCCIGDRSCTLSGPLELAFLPPHIPRGKKTVKSGTTPNCQGGMSSAGLRPGPHRHVELGELYPTHPQTHPHPPTCAHMCCAPDSHATVSCKVTGASAGTALPVLWDLLKRRRLKVDEQVSEGFSVQCGVIGFWPQDRGQQQTAWTEPARTLKCCSTFWKPRPGWTSASLHQWSKGPCSGGWAC